jgi:hypothetical protein
MEPLRDDQLIAELQALRPTPRPAFAAELDERAAAGFPRRSRLPEAPLARLVEKLRTVPPRRLLLPVGGLAVLAIAVTTALVASQEGSNHQLLSLRPPGAAETPSPRQLTHKTQREGRILEHPQPPEAEVSTPEATSGAGAAITESSGTVNFNGSANFNGANIRNRDVERAAEVVLGAEPEEVADDAAKVFEAVHANRGIVMRSSTRQGAAGEAGARFVLLIPSTKLPDALAAFSEIDEVLSRHEATADITAPTVSTGELLKESRARIDSLLAQLEETATESEREAVEAELRHERRHASRLATQLTHLHRRADFSRVSLRIVTGADESSGGGAWGIDNALDDAGHVLTVAAAVTLVALAVIGPVALIALLAWLSHRAWVRRQRRRVLS